MSSQPFTTCVGVTTGVHVAGAIGARYARSEPLFELDGKPRVALRQRGTS
jgi:hypothetical protein